MANASMTREPELPAAPPMGVEPGEDRPHELRELGPLEDGLVAGRPIEDRSFELVEVAAGAAAGMIVGSAVAGPIGTLVGGVAGAAAGLLTGEAVERAAGRAATTTDATEE